MQPKTAKITKIIDENPSVKTFYFEHKLKSQPGQFVMLWLPDVDQKPFSISSDDGETFGLTVFKRGPLTEKLFALKVGDRAGVTGPFGTTYSILPDRHYIMVAGGYGAAPLGFLAEVLVSKNQNTKIDFIAGARSKDLLLFENRLKKINGLNLHFTTDDGSAGRKGRVTDVLEELLIPSVIPAKAGIQLSNSSIQPLDPRLRGDDNKLALVVTCGPELMEKGVLDLCNKYDTDCELSIERHMKCGFGICGQCAVDDLGICMCIDGTVVNRATANKIFELGKYHRDKAGNTIKF